MDAALVALARRFRGRQVGTYRQLLVLLLGAWASLDRDDLDRSFAGFLDLAVPAVVAAQLTNAAAAPRYVTASLAAPGGDGAALPLNPKAFAGSTVDGRPLAGLLRTGLVETKRQIAAGRTPEAALPGGFARMGRAVRTEVMDAGRQASNASMLLAGTGYVRHITAPACPRCMILSGRRYRGSEAFRRHPQCDCVPLPLRRSTRPGPDGRTLFGRMTAAEQDQLLGKARAQAVRDGADLYAEVNKMSRGGAMTVPGQIQLGASGKPLAHSADAYYRQLGKPSPIQLWHDAGQLDGHQATVFKQLMREHGYLLND